MRSIAFYSVFLVAACAAKPLLALQSQDVSRESSMTSSVFEDLEELPIDFASPFVKELLDYSSRFPEPTRTEVAFVDALQTQRPDRIRELIDCSRCFGVMHELSAATLKCGHVMHEKCFIKANKNKDGEVCPICADPGPHNLRTRRTVITKALGIFEQVGLIPPMHPSELDEKRVQVWKLSGGIKIRDRFIESLRSLRFLMGEIFRYTIDQISTQRGWRFSRLFYRNRSGIVGTKSKSRMLMLYQLRVLVERIHSGLPESRMLDIPSMPASHRMSRSQALDYIATLFEIVEMDFETKLTAEYTAVPNPSLFSRWEDRIWWLEVLVRTLMSTFVEPTPTSRAISTLFSSYVRALPFWTHPESAIVTMEFPFGKSIQNHLFAVLDPTF